MIGWKNSIKIKNTKAMNIQEFLLENSQLEEGLIHSKLSDKIEKLLEKLDEKKFLRSSPEDKNALDKAEEALKEMLPEVKKIEKSFEKGNMSRRQALLTLRKFKGKSLAVKKYLQEKRVLSKIDWKFLISTGLSLIWIPLTVWRARDLMNILFPVKGISK